ncbi:STAS domain-containing protein [Rhodococcus sp. T2V]|uniref:STAS domain-containing protein n=1 Tax=Rhodococcus sp. T2V TaxID=3034164 RepID=UPI0023E19E65|nr:STAS domain-containing protein [Rhodococcus sp. T2V]MDF3312614.1 STAS domain-containing protein [Rhodococcus sp. T2V]
MTTYPLSATETPTATSSVGETTATPARDADVAHRQADLQILIDESADGPVMLTVRGDIDIVSAPLLAACLDQAAHHPGPGVVVDLLDVPFLGCPALAVLAAAANELGRDCRALAVAADEPHRRLLHRTRIDTAIGCYSTVADAFRAARTPTTHASSPTVTQNGEPVSSWSSPSFPYLIHPPATTCSITDLSARDHPPETHQLRP